MASATLKKIRSWGTTNVGRTCHGGVGFNDPILQIQTPKLKKRNKELGFFELLILAAL
jgi:hypothetical protein